MGDLADRIAMDRTTLARNLKPLERDKYIVVAVGEDRRERIVSVTASGRKTLEGAIPLWRAVQTRFEGKVGKREARRIFELTQSLIAVGRELSDENAETL